MAKKKKPSTSKADVECRPVRTDKKTGVKTVEVSAYKRSTPKPLPKCPK